MSAAQPDRPLIALVEDDAVMAELVCDMLAALGVDVELFSLGKDLFKSKNFLKFKIVILDLSLPDIDGFDMMERLASECIGMSLVLISGHDLGVVRAAKIYGNGLGLRVRGALTKPFAREQLFAALGLRLTTELGQAL
jgi:FixJ family two-component response regulator